MNILAILTASLIPLLIGALWFNPKVFGNALMKANGIDPNDPNMKRGHKPVVYIVTFIMSLIIAFFLQAMVIHQFHLYSMFYKLPVTDPSTPAGSLFKSVMDMVGTSYRTFKHGAFHGFLSGLTIITPVLTVQYLFEGKGFKFIAIHALYWTISLMIMGGILSAWM
jgi:hypothetical protein